MEILKRVMSVLLITLFVQLVQLVKPPLAQANESKTFASCGSALRSYVLKSAFRTLFFPIFGPSIFHVAAEWQLGLKATWKTGTLLEDVSTLIREQEVKPAEQRLLEFLEDDLPTGIKVFYQKFVKEKQGYENLRVAQLIKQLHYFNQSAVEKDNCFLPCHSDGSLMKCTRRHLLRWILPHTVLPETEIVDGVEWQRVELEPSSQEVEGVF